MSQNSQDAIDVLSKVIVDTIEKKLNDAKFDKSQTGVVTAVNGNTYTISVFGSQYNITSDTRRTFNLDIFPQKGFSVSQFSTEEWTSKMLRLQIGMKAPTSVPLVGADAVRIQEKQIDAKIKNSAIYKEKDTELRQAKWRYKVGGYEQYGNIENINRKRIVWTDENKKKYAAFVKEQGDVGTYCSYCVRRV